MLKIRRLMTGKFKILKEGERFILLRGKRERKTFLLPKEIRLGKLAWILGIIAGDRAGNSKKSIGISNNSFPIVRKFVAEMRSVLSIRPNLLVMNINTKEHIDKKWFPENLEIPIVKIYVTKVVRIRKPLFQPLLFSRTIATLFSNFQKVLEKTWQKDTLIASEFVKGFCDAEASIHKRDKAIEIRQKSTKEGKNVLTLVQKMLSSFGIKSAMEGPNCENMLILRVLGGKRNLGNLMKFKTNIGFNHPEKNKTFENIINELYPTQTTLWAIA